MEDVRRAVRGVGTDDPRLRTSEHAPAAGVRSHRHDVLVELRVPRLAEPEHLAQRRKPYARGARVRAPQPQHTPRTTHRGGPPACAEPAPLSGAPPGDP